MTGGGYHCHNRRTCGIMKRTVRYETMMSETVCRKCATLNSTGRTFDPIIPVLNTRTGNYSY